MKITRRQLRRLILEAVNGLELGYEVIYGDIYGPFFGINRALKHDSSERLQKRISGTTGRESNTRKFLDSCKNYDITQEKLDNLAKFLDSAEDLGDYKEGFAIMFPEEEKQLIVGMRAVVQENNELMDHPEFKMTEIPENPMSKSKYHLASERLNGKDYFELVSF